MTEHNYTITTTTNELVKEEPSKRLTLNQALKHYKKSQKLSLKNVEKFIQSALGTRKVELDIATQFKQEAEILIKRAYKMIQAQEKQHLNFRLSRPEDAEVHIRELNLEPDTLAQLSKWKLVYIGELDTFATANERLMTVDELTQDWDEWKQPITPEVRQQVELLIALDKNRPLKSWDERLHKVFNQLDDPNLFVTCTPVHPRYYRVTYPEPWSIQVEMLCETVKRTLGGVDLGAFPVIGGVRGRRVVDTRAHTIFALSSDAYEDIDNALAKRENE